MDGTPSGSSTQRSDEQLADRLDSWKAIATYLKRDISTVQRWEKLEKMPVHRHLHGKLGSVYAFRPELDTWWRNRSVRLRHEDDRTATSSATLAPNPVSTPRRQLLPRRWRLIGGVAAVVSATLFYLLTLGRGTTATHPEIRSVAVLPLVNLSGDPTQEYFADGITEALIDGLAQMSVLKT